MRERDFRRAYAALQRDVTAPEDLVARTMAAMRVAGSRPAAGPGRAEGGARERAAAPSARAQAAARPRRRPAVRREGRRSPLMIAVAACVSLGLVAFGLTAPLRGGAPSGSGQDAESLFAVRAYAATTGAAFEGSGDTPKDIILFPMDTRTEHYSAPTASGEVYSGALFTVEGEGIERVQATLSRGEVYAYAVEDFLVADDPEKAAEAGSWQPKMTGTGKHYGGYDVVTRLWGESGADDPYAHVRTIKRLGPTMDVAVEATSPGCWGLWLDVDVRPNVEVADGVWDTVVDLEAMEGETLTVTAQFADGTFQTQVIGLHAGWFKGEPTVDAQGVADLLPTGRPYPAEEVAADDGSVHALYGTLESVSDEAHPYPLDDANRYADEVAPSAYDITSSLESFGTTATIEGVPEASAVHEASGPRTVRLSAVKESEPVEVVVSDVRWEVTDVLPSSFDLYEDTKVRAFQGNIEYMNKCRSVTNGWAVDEEGRVSEGNSFVVVEFDAQLAGPADHESMISEFGQVCRIDEAAGQTVFAKSGLFAALDTGYHDPADSFDCAIMGRVRLRPGEVNHVTLVFIADDAVARGDGLAFACPSPPLSAQGFIGNPPAASELELVALR